MTMVMTAPQKVLNLVFSTGANYTKVCSIFRISEVQITGVIVMILREENWSIFLEKFRQMFLRILIEWNRCLNDNACF